MASTWYQTTADAANIPADVAERALEWLLELQGEDVAPEVVEALQRWRAAHPDHERAWQRIESVKDRLRPLSSPVTAEFARAALAPPGSPGPTRRRRAIKVLALSLFAGGLAWSARDQTAWRQWAADHRTAVGERRVVMLPDGTQLWLNTASAVDIEFDAVQRRVRLLAGEILIATAKDDASPSRPFLVETAQGTAQALGTRYVVRQRGDDTDVSVFEGKVEIRPNGRGNDGRSIVLPAGYRASYTADGITSPAPAETAGASWAEGFIVARSMRLDDFLVELGRYSNDALSCDPALAGLRVSGSFPVDDIGKVLSALGTTLDVRTEVVTRLWGRREIRLTPKPAA
ncbi:FecR domain-containing protein [Cupriavidus sp. UGS-1]|uniref:FecR domain-containing protein n=1 Tax=Cupriavidus sp. UGS-1 TaxID=2899826 RepID=UPI001E53D099|nr:FecR family protein [Cupriavidus sp. UGS-1]MCD9120687.1 FecR family protein [Cupriavidus sp. UGS-1]